MTMMFRRRFSFRHTWSVFSRYNKELDKNNNKQTHVLNAPTRRIYAEVLKYLDIPNHE